MKIIEGLNKYADINNTYWGFKQICRDKKILTEILKAWYLNDQIVCWINMFVHFLELVSLHLNLPCIMKYRTKWLKGSKLKVERKLAPRVPPWNCMYSVHIDRVMLTRKATVEPAELSGLPLSPEKEKATKAWELLLLESGLGFREVFLLGAVHTRNTLHAVLVSFWGHIWS